MSSILRALKKLENDKATRRPDELKIDSEILRADNSHRFSPAGMILISLLLLASGSGATYLLMKHGKSPESEPVKTPRISGQFQHPSPQATVVETEKLPEEVVVIPAQLQNDAKAETRGQLKPPPSAGTARTVAGSKPSRPIELQDIPASPAHPHPSATATAVPLLRVNGIAVQDGMDGVAMINGMPVTNGSVIDGVKIEEILKNKVRFSYNGDKFEIELGQSNR